jgi:cobalt/nickel transport system permease protein
VTAAERLPPHTKIVGTLLFVIAAVATPREAVWAHVLIAAIVVVAARAARVSLVTLARRLTIGLPFVAFALALPFVAEGETVEVLGLTLSRDGLWGAWNIVAKATIGLASTSLLLATTDVTELLRGFDRLRAPRVFTAIAGFMVRYLDVVSGELHRMRVARISRADDPRWLWQARAVAATAGTLFVRSFERGERVHLAMLSRGFAGTMPVMATQAATSRDWVESLAPAVAAAVICAFAWSVV